MKPATKTAHKSGRKPRDPKGMRQRVRSDGTVRVWWEPRADARALGFEVVELDGNRMEWSRKEAATLNTKVEAALAGDTPKARRGQPRRTIDDLISSYRQSAHWKAELAPKTRDSYGKLLDLIAKKWGTRAVADFDKAAMATWYEALFTEKGTRMAQAMIRMMSVLFGQAERLGWRPENSNPCFRLRVVTAKPRNRYATDDELAAIFAGARALGLVGVELAIALALYQGQRQTDILHAPRGAFTLFDVVRDGQLAKVLVWKLTRSKRGNAGAMEIHPDVLPLLRRVLADTGTTNAPRGPDDPLILDGATAAPFGEFLFNKRWHAVLDWAADPDLGGQPSVQTLQFRDLRRTFGVLARAGGASNNDVGDVLGNSAATNPQLEETYMPASFTTASRAVLAVQRPEKKRTKG